MEAMTIMMMILLLLLHLFNAGKQAFGAATNVMAFYCIGLPLAWLFCFHFQFGVGGLILGATNNGGIFVITISSNHHYYYPYQA